MLLVIDAGNTNVVVAVHDGQGWRGPWRIRTEAQRTSDEYAVWLLALLSHAGVRPADISAAAIATVVPAALYHLRHLCRDWLNVEPLIARANLDWGFAIKVDQPEEVGADRLVNALAAHRRYSGPLIVIDFGTATTFDVVDKDGNYCGGAIAPGINLSIAALHMAAAKLPSVRIRRTDVVIGKDTEACMQSGLFWGYIGLVEGLVARIKKEFGAPMSVIGTGGLAPLFDGATPVIEKVDPNLTLWGLRLIYERNRKP